jgi:hypothetical protein
MNSGIEKQKPSADPSECSLPRPALSEAEELRPKIRAPGSATRVLAARLLRLQRVDHEKASRKVKAHASQPGEAGIGRVALTVAMGAAIASTRSTKPDG